MKSRSIFILSLILLLMVPLSISQASAYPGDTTLCLDITYANYLDLDDDGIQDDIITHFNLMSPFYYDVYMIGSLDLTLVLPSGFIFYATLGIDRVVGNIEVIIEWYNCATEPGWYDFQLELRTYAITPFGRVYWVEDYDSLIFDPPEEFPPGSDPIAYVYW